MTACTNRLSPQTILAFADDVIEYDERRRILRSIRATILQHLA